MMALVISPVQAAGITLPILIAMDWVSVWSYRKHWDTRILLIMLPGALVGIVSGGLLTSHVDDQFVRLCVGLIAIGFPLYVFFTPKGPTSIATGNTPLGVIAGTAAGFTSFIANASGPPFQSYALSQGLGNYSVIASTLRVTLTRLYITKQTPDLPYQS